MPKSLLFFEEIELVLELKDETPNDISPIVNIRSDVSKSDIPT